MPSRMDAYYKLSDYFNSLLDTDPVNAVRQAQEINLDVPPLERINLMGLKAAILVDGGSLTKQQNAIKDGLALFRELHSQYPTANMIYNLANGLVAEVGYPPQNSTWLDHQESTRKSRAEARQCFWKVAQDVDADSSLRTQAWTNLANQFSASYRLGEAHDAWLAALKADPMNGVAASSAARNLFWFYKQGNCSDLTRIEAAMLAKIARRHQERIIQYAGMQAAEQIDAFVSEFEEPSPRLPHSDPFISWLEEERLTLAPVVELVDPTLGKLDWLTLPGILERETDNDGIPPPVFAMFNMLKSDFILARDLAWRAINENTWPTTGRFADTLDYASYGPDISALILAHRTVLDLLDKVAVTANHYFEFGLAPNKVYFGRLWRDKPDKKTGVRPLTVEVEKVIRAGANALYGLVELADDYDSDEGILRSQKDLRNAGTHRFVILHDFGDPTDSRSAPEVEHHRREPFTYEVLRAMRVARAAIQMLALAISQHEQNLEQRTTGIVGSLIVPDHDWIRGMTSWHYQIQDNAIISNFLVSHHCLATT